MNLCTAVICLAVTIPVQGGKTPPPDRWIGEDKWKHFFASFVATSLTAGAARAVGLKPEQSAYVGASVGAGFGVWKELRDRGAPAARPSFKDLVWDAAGVGAGALVATRAR